MNRYLKKVRLQKIIWKSMDLKKKYTHAMENWCRLMRLVGKEIGHICCGDTP